MVAINGIGIDLRCEAQAMSGFTWTYKWLQGNQVVNNNSNTRIHYNHLTSTLSIRPKGSETSYFSKGEINLYRCTASNANGTIISKAARIISGCKYRVILTSNLL